MQQIYRIIPNILMHNDHLISISDYDNANNLLSNAKIIWSIPEEYISYMSSVIGQNLVINVAVKVSRVWLTDNKTCGIEQYSIQLTYTSVVICLVTNITQTQTSYSFHCDVTDTT